MQESDYLILGAGIVGLAIAKALKENYPEARIHILEKEKEAGRHSSGRNSGVLHAGFYYNADSLKAKFTKIGNRELKEFCKTHKLGLNENGKVVVAKTPEETAGIDELARRGGINGVDVRIIDEQELKELEPNAFTHEKALYSPTTATVDPEEITQKLKSVLAEQGVDFFMNEGFQKNLGSNTIESTQQRRFKSGRIINAAGLYADKIAKSYGYSQDYTIIPFKGVYLKYTNPDKPVHMNIYPVPNLKNPFLGVHYTVTVEGTVKIGPTSMPAFWRENYDGWSNFSANELFPILGWEARLFLTNAFGFRRLAISEIKKYHKPYFINLATKMVREIDRKGFNQWSTPGIRAQLLNKKTSELVQDFVVEGDSDTIHVLNAVSPAFTSAFPFGRWVVDHYIAG